MKIDCTGCLHGHYPKLEGGDLLIVTGDLTARDTLGEMSFEFITWIEKQNYQKKIVIAGNHDTILENEGVEKIFHPFCDYLLDSGTEFEGLKIWGSPWTLKFKGQNPHAMAFCVDTEEELAEKWAMIPDDTDILVTHGPPKGILDRNIYDVSCGSKSLRRIMGKVKPKIWVFSHIHEEHGEYKDNTLSGIEYHFINCSHVNERYKPVNKPVRVGL